MPRHLPKLEQDFAYFGYPYTVVIDNSFLSEEFQTCCCEHLIGAPYHPATNGAAECIVQTFKQALNKSILPQAILIPHRKRLNQTLCLVKKCS